MSEPQKPRWVPKQQGAPPVPRPFEPKIGDRLTIDGADYSFAEHPAARGRLYRQVARRAAVYQLVADDGQPYALKVFKAAYRTPRVAEGVVRLHPFATLPGLQVCDRSVLTPERHPGLIAEFPDLAYAVLMPWVAGDTWQECVLMPLAIDQRQSWFYAHSLARALDAMEQRQIAHCDLSAPNLILQPQNNQIALIDVEDLYAPGMPRPESPPAGSDGYAHKTVQHGVWCAEADRFAGAVLFAEMLGWHQADVRQRAYGEHYFDPAELQSDCPRYRLLFKALRQHWGKDLASTFGEAWFSPALELCPRLHAWKESIDAAQRASFAVASAQPPSPPAPEPAARPASGMSEVAPAAPLRLPPLPEPAAPPRRHPFRAIFAVLVGIFLTLLLSPIGAMVSYEILEDTQVGFVAACLLGAYLTFRAARRVYRGKG